MATYKTRAAGNEETIATYILTMKKIVHVVYKFFDLLPDTIGQLYSYFSFRCQLSEISYLLFSLSKNYCFSFLKYTIKPKNG